MFGKKKEKTLTTTEALHMLKNLITCDVDECCMASMDKEDVIEKLEKIKKLIEEIDEKENPKDLNNLSASWRLLESEYTRLPGFKREISYWLNTNKMKKIDIEEINPDELKLYLNKKTDYFVKLAEDIIESNFDIISRLITLESLRYFTKRIDKKYLPFLAYKLQFLLENK